MPKQKDTQERSWYAVHTYSGYEDAVARYLKQRVESLDIHDKIFNIIVPKEKKIKIKGGRRYTAEEKVYPGYVLVEMILNDDSWYVVRNTPRVTGFIGADSTTPTPLSEQEVSEIMKRTGVEEPKYKIDLRVGDVVKITDGPFKDFDGKINELDEATAKVKVLVSIFGRETPVELDFLQVKKI
ncbi:MAG: transcription termination/antitermination protein NusG [bacterium]|nr:transcription termination/antitermination protein NusG [bacterium]